MWHSTFIALHALAGLVALVCGCLALYGRYRLLTAYLISLALMTILLAAAIGADWDSIGTGARVLFVAFIALACFMVWRGWMAYRLRRGERYVDHLGFTLVALLDAFMVILVLDLTGSGLAAVTTGVVVAVAGHHVLVAVKRRLLSPAEPPAELRRTS